MVKCDARAVQIGFVNLVRADPDPRQPAGYTATLRLPTDSADTDDRIILPSADSPHAVTAAEDTLIIRVAAVRPFID